MILAPNRDDRKGAIFLIFLVKFCFVSVGAKLDPGEPGRRSTHLFADGFYIYIAAAFDDQLIVNMSADEAMGECTHGIAEDVPADCLDDVLYEFRTVRFDAFPFLC